MAKMFVKNGNNYAKWEDGTLCFWRFRQGHEFINVPASDAAKIIAAFVKGTGSITITGLCRDYSPPMTRRWRRRARRWLRCLQMGRSVA